MAVTIAAVAVALGAVLLASTLPETLEARRTDQTAELAAGLAIRRDAAACGIARPVVLTHRDEVAHHARGEWCMPPDGDGRAALAQGRAAGARYAAIRARGGKGHPAERRWPGIEAALAAPPWRLMHEGTDGKGRFLVFRLEEGAR